MKTNLLLFAPTLNLTFLSHNTHAFKKYKNETTNLIPDNPFVHRL